MRSIEMSARTVEDALEAACQALGVDRDDLNVSYEVLEFPARKLFKTIPAKVRVTVEEPETTAPVAEAPAAVETAAPVAEPAAPVEAAPETPAEIPAEAPAAPAEEPAGDEEVALDIASDARLQAAVDYLTPIFKLMGVEDFAFSALKKGEATILRVTGTHMGALIGRRGETMESLSYLASLVVNRMEGPYIKLGLDVGGYRGKREDDLAALARRIADRVIRTGCYYEMEPMNPYERHIIHTAVADIEGVRSESKGEGPNRRVVIYSTDPNASNLPDRDNARNARGGRRDGGRGNRREGGRGPRREGRSGRGGRGPRREGGSRYSGPKSSVPGREFADAPRDPNAQPMAPKVTERIHDGDDFAFGKIEL
ncbi:RNA-binding cell elongation regulator Jag/EloR [Subdoligranulum variabile]|uniref:RNA-binding cell elongation regulator Jag/EloR n=1 Tax=Subdoligranulum variabile TaxID=214851 RepID=UPI002942C8BF|nr:RNA-binding cell elongation regulator Jag/EloR [Subdoligranulum variabile]